MNDLQMPKNAFLYYFCERVCVCVFAQFSVTQLNLIQFWQRMGHLGTAVLLHPFQVPE